MCLDLLIGSICSSISENKPILNTCKVPILFLTLFWFSDVAIFNFLLYVVLDNVRSAITLAWRVSRLWNNTKESIHIVWHSIFFELLNNFKCTISGDVLKLCLHLWLLLATNVLITSRHWLNVITLRPVRNVCIVFNPLCNFINSILFYFILFCL